MVLFRSPAMDYDVEYIHMVKDCLVEVVLNTKEASCPANGRMVLDQLSAFELRTVLHQAVERFLENFKYSSCCKSYHVLLLHHFCTLMFIFLNFDFKLL